MKEVIITGAGLIGKYLIKNFKSKYKVHVFTTSKRKIKSPIGNDLTCKGWQQEAAYRMLQNNLDNEVAENPDDLIVYGGLGKAARNWESYDKILKCS